MTAREALHAAGLYGVERRDAELLLLHVLDWQRPALRAHPEATLTQEQFARFRALLERRSRREPVQYILGQQEFFGLSLMVSPAVLIPRPETELLVEAVLDWVAKQTTAGLLAEEPAIADVGTGSGAIVLALASRLPRARLWGIDISPGALLVAQANARHLQLSERVSFQAADLLAVSAHATQPLPALLDVVVSNPPYVPASDAPTLQPEVRDFEPRLALFAGADGLDVYKRLIPAAFERLRPRGLLAMEFGYGQQETLAELLARLQNVQFGNDYAGIPRYVLAERP